MASNSLDVASSTNVAVNALLRRNLTNFGEHNIIGRGLLYKKGHLVSNWRHRAWVINDFSTHGMEVKDRDGQFRYFKPQAVEGFDRDTSNLIESKLGITSEQKIIKLDTVWVKKGEINNIQECHTIYQDTAFPLHVVFENKDLVGLSQKMEFDFIFDYSTDAEDFLRSLYQAAKHMPDLEKCIDESKLSKKNVLRQPRLTFRPQYQTSLGCIKLAPYCTYPDCVGWGSYCNCCCCETYSQGGLICDMQPAISGNMAPAVYAQCCVMEALICQCRPVRSCQLKMESMVCCIDFRFALPCDDSVPFQIEFFGCNLFGSKPNYASDTELEPLQGQHDAGALSFADKTRSMLGMNQGTWS